MDSIPDHIVTKAQTVIQSLEKLFASIGYSSARQSELYINLWNQVDNVYDEVLRHQEGERDRIIQQLLTKQNAVELLETQLGLPHYALAKNTTLLEQGEELTKHELHLFKVKEERLAQILKLENDLKAICIDLGEPINNPIGSDLSAEAIKDLERKISSSREEQSRRATEMADVLSNISKLSYELEESTETELHCPDHSKETLAKLASVYQALNTEKSARKAELQSIWASLVEIWNKLDISQADRASYLESRVGLSKHTIAGARSELERLHQEMEGRLRELVEKAMAKIRRLWSDLSINTAEQQEYEGIYSEQYDEEALDAHKRLIQKLEAKWKLSQPIFQLLERRAALISDREKVRESEANPDRFGKGNSSHLLQESKLRAHVEKKLPVIEAELMAKLEAWKQTYGEPLKRNFVDLHAQIAADMLADAHEKAEKAKKGAEKKQARKEVPTPAPSPAPLVGMGGFVGIPKTPSRAPSDTPSKIFATPSKIVPSKVSPTPSKAAATPSKIASTPSKAIASTPSGKSNPKKRVLTDAKTPIAKRLKQEPFAQLTNTIDSVPQE